MAIRDTAGPHIIPWPHTLAIVAPSTVVPSRSTSGPTNGRWSGVYSIVAAHAFLMPRSRVAGTRVASRRCIRRRYAQSIDRPGPGSSSGFDIPHRNPPSSGRQ